MSIFCYHAVESGWESALAVPPDVFERQLQWIRRHHQVVPLSQAVARLDRRGRPPRRLSALTFDDGFTSVYEHAWPRLRRLALPATVFLVAETLTPPGRAVDWVDDAPSHPLTTMTCDQVLEMRASGVEFASHSFSHLDLTTLSYESCVADLRHSREVLEDLLERPVPFLAYPRGRNNAVVRTAAQAAGYTHSFSLPEWPEPTGPHGIPRVGLYPWNAARDMWGKAQPEYLALRTGRVFPLARRLAIRGRHS